MSDKLKLMALDSSDLTVISACVQDAVLLASDFSFSKSGSRLILPMNRFVWEKKARTFSIKQKHERRKSVLHFNRVTTVRTIHIDRSDEAAVLSLLNITFEPDENGGEAEASPSGTLIATFAGGAELQADVECIEAQLTDLDSAWAASGKPRHSG